MAFPNRYRNVRRRRRPAFKKYGKKYSRSRFQKKRFARNNVNQLTMRAPLASRLLRIKLPWVKSFDPVVAVSGSQSYAFQGNAIVPYTASGQSGLNTPASGDSLPAGEVEYSGLYDRYFVNGSSIKVEVVSINSQQLASSPLVRAVLLAIPFVSPGSGDNWQANKAQLDAYSYDQLLAWQYAKWRMLGSNAGGSSRLIFKMFRKTKSMSGLKDLRDNIEYSGDLTDGSLSSASMAGINPLNGFMYYLRFFNHDATTTAPLAITVRMSLYMTMTNREFNPIQTITT